LADSWANWIRKRIVYLLLEVVIFVATASSVRAENVTGWNYLINGEVGMAAFSALNEPTGGWLIFMFWILITMIIVTRTNSWELATIIGIIFLTVFLTQPWFTSMQIGGAILFMVFLLGITLFRLAAKEKSI